MLCLKKYLKGANSLMAILKSSVIISAVPAKVLSNGIFFPYVVVSLFISIVAV